MPPKRIIGPLFSNLGLFGFYRMPPIDFGVPFIPKKAGALILLGGPRLIRNTRLLSSVQLGKNTGTQFVMGIVQVGSSCGDRMS